MPTGGLYWASTRRTLRPAGIPYGFPGPAGHNRAYNKLRSARLRVLRRRLQEGHRRGAKVMYLTGVHRGESQRRKQRQPVTYHGSIVFVNPLIDWTNDDMRAYRAEHAIPESDVAALLHPLRRVQLRELRRPRRARAATGALPEWFDATIASLEREAQAAGIGSCRWGERTVAEVPADAGALCTDCQLRLEVA